MTFSDSIITCLKKYGDFKGRASRSELWWFALFTMLLSLTMMMIDPTKAFIVTLIFLMPSVAVGVRRLRDAGLHTGWILLWPLTMIEPHWLGLPEAYKAVCGLAAVALIILWCQKAKAPTGCEAKESGSCCGAPEPLASGLIGSDWTPCVKLPVVVHVRERRESETHVNTREGLAPIKPDDLIMRGDAGEEYLINREVFQRTYTLDMAQPNVSSTPQN